MTELNIVNYALDRLGAQRAASMEDTGKNARLAISNYDIVRDKVLRLYVWPCITKRQALVLAEGAEGLPRLPYAYAAPTDCARLHEVYSSGVMVQHLMEGGIIYCEAPDAVARYNKDSEDPNEWDKILQSAVGILLAAEIADAVTSKSDKGKELYAEFMQVVSTAQGVGQAEATAEPAAAPLWVDY